MPVDELVGAPPAGDPRVHLRPFRFHDMTVIPLPASRRIAGVQAGRHRPAAGTAKEMQVHEGYEWLYVLDGQLRLILGDQDLVLRPGEAAEFGTKVPHWFGNTDKRPAELLVIFGRQGERAISGPARAARRAGGPRRHLRNPEIPTTTSRNSSPAPAGLLIYRWFLVTTETWRYRR